MGWTGTYGHWSNKKEFAQHLLDDLSWCRGSESDCLVYDVLDYSLNKDGLSILCKYHDDYVNWQSEKNGKPFLNGKFIIHYLISKERGSNEWCYKGLDDSCGISIPNCPKRIIDNFKSDNPYWERAKEQENFTFSTISYWEQAKEKRKEKAVKSKSVMSVIRNAIKNGADYRNIQVMLVDGCSFKGSSLDNEWLQMARQDVLNSKRQKLLIQIWIDEAWTNAKSIKKVRINGEEVFSV